MLVDCVVNMDCMLFRIPQKFREAMKRLPGKAAETPQTRKPDSATKDIQRPLVRKRTGKKTLSAF